MISSLKNKLYTVIFSLLIVVGCVLPMTNFAEATPPKYDQNFTSDLTSNHWLIAPKDYNVSKDKTLRENVVALFYPNEKEGGNLIYKVIRDMTLGLMIVYIIWAGASLLFSKKPEKLQETLRNFLYILLGGGFIYGANRLFGSVLHFNSDQLVSGGTGMQGLTNAVVGQGGVFFFVLSALKAAAFFLAIVMVVITGIRVIAAAEAEKGKKLVKGLINVVVALLVIKGVDFVYYLAEDSANFVEKAADFIINVARIFGYIYGVIIVIMVFVAGYLYITDGGGGSNFKKASNILVNILLSGLALFVFLLILYQVFAEFQTGGDAVTENATTALINLSHLYV